MCGQLVRSDSGLLGGETEGGGGGGEAAGQDGVEGGKSMLAGRLAGFFLPQKYSLISTRHGKQNMYTQ